MTGRIKRPEKRVDISLPRIGMIKTGFKAENGHPRSVDYFIPTGLYSSYFTESYGAKPSLIQVVFLSDDPGTVCDERYEYRDNEGKLFARGNGHTFEIWNEKNDRYETLTVEDYPNVMASVQKRCSNRKGWEVTLTLRFIIPKIPGVLGHWQFTTKGQASTIPSIRDTFDTVLEQKGFIKGIVFDLSVAFAKSQKPGKKSRYPVVNLIPNHSQANLEIVKRSLISFDSNRKALNNEGFEKSK